MAGNLDTAATVLRRNDTAAGGSLPSLEVTALGMAADIEQYGVA
jgi:hypothetical protein